MENEDRDHEETGTMTHRERALAALRYQPYDRLPIVHFGYWGETLRKWCAEGHLNEEDIQGYGDGNAVDVALATKLGFDFNWQNMFYTHCRLRPGFEGKVVKEFPDGSRHVLNGNGVVTLHRTGATGIPAEIDHLLKDRDSWEEYYKWRYEWSEDRVDQEALARVRTEPRDRPLGLHCGSLFGAVRDVLGVVGVSYLYVDDEPLFREIIDAVGELCYRNTKLALASGARFDFAHFWEDICFKNGPLVNPKVFQEYVGPHYKRITELVGAHGLDIVSLDSDGMIDALIPTWIENGVNTMFPIEVGTWGSSIGPWREKYGKELRGVGGMNKTVFARDSAAVDAEVERLIPLVELGGYIPCPDHRIAPDARYELVRHYCDRMRQAFQSGG
ncbi:MAG: uroporphyrinogen decarboxylase family protein, partial [Planctomycetota bacterium]|jgi:uroporphyrinogen decarboxylase|nr:uroporphyrinogen decarboxylase family protein [Planctomycetota bacterium]